MLGPRIAELASAAGEDRLLAVAQPVLVQLRDLTGESAQLYRRQADIRVCVAAAERASGLRDTVPVGAALPMTAGSAAQVLLAWEEAERMHRGLRGAKFTAPRWPASAGGAGRPARPSARPGWPRSPRRCAGRRGGRAGRQGARRRLGVRADRAADPVPGPAARRRGGGGGREDQRTAPGRGRRPGRERRVDVQARYRRRRERNSRPVGTPAYHQQIWSRPGANMHKLHV